MEVVTAPSPAELSLAGSLAQRRLEVHVQCVRSLAQTDPRAIAGLIAKWLREDRRN
ncbi:MAG TPA: hypothetical protein VK457_16805 [Chloroflexota bacterium]|jgi:flagellar biosynthesis/type III secretory pathway M-ring protein FliF/YscJ|nr:hypothetical protein [Chloroflexota bacterium]